MRISFISIAFLFSISTTFATVSETVKKDTTYVISPDDAILKMIDSRMASKFFETIGIDLDSNIIENSSVELVDSILEQRIRLLDQESPIKLDYNEYVKAFINLYAVRKRGLVSNVLGLAPVYYPMFEEVLDRYDMPLELKHLAVVESALIPVAKSRVGAQGLWQFMYRTGKMYGLNVTSYYDERMDPYKSTVAACEYMKDLYGMYGDWLLVLAAYNSGPGNVNKAIRRSGGKKDFWEISQFLPKETRGYVPAFIAVNYVMNYYKEHQISANVLNEYAFITDTIHLNREYSFNQIAEYIDISEEQLTFLNPSYKLKFIPKTDKTQTLCLPKDKVGLFLVNEEAIVADIRRSEVADSLDGKAKVKEEVLPEAIQHTVRSGEFLGSIANKYHCTVNQLMSWNNKRSTHLNPGDKLTIYTNGKTIVNEESKAKEPAVVKNDGRYKVHIVRSGDTLWDIAKEYNGTSVNDLKELNSNLDFKRLKPGMKVKVKEIG